MYPYESNTTAIATMSYDERLECYHYVHSISSGYGRRQLKRLTYSHVCIRPRCAAL